MIVKVCGTTSEDDALLAVAMGADMVGFVFAPSPRRIAPQLAADIVKRLPREIITVGVFKDESPDRVVQITHRSGLAAAQLHGDESAEVTRWVRERVPLVIKAFPAGDRHVASAADYGADAILLDAPHPGSGQVFDWSLAAEAPIGLSVIIAGGLTPDNVAAAVASTQPWGVDVVSGVEREPGKKDPVKLRAFVANAKAAAPETDMTWRGAHPVPGGRGVYDWQDDQ